MSTCVMEHCEAEGGRVNINFNTGSVRYEARVPMCVECWETFRRIKHNGQSAECHVLFTEVPGQVVDLGVTGRLATVKSMRFES